jgi:hypothetical protein
MIDLCPKHKGDNNIRKSGKYLSFHWKSGASYLSICICTQRIEALPPVHRILLKDEYIRNVLNKRAFVLFLVVS